DMRDLFKVQGMRVIGVDRSVEQSNPHRLHRITSKRAHAHCRSESFLYGHDKFSRDRPSADVIDEFQTGKTVRPGRQLEMDLREIPGTAILLPQCRLMRHRSCEDLFVRDLWLSAVHFKRKFAT